MKLGIAKEAFSVTSEPSRAANEWRDMSESSAQGTVPFSAESVEGPL